MADEDWGALGDKDGGRRLPICSIGDSVGKYFFGEGDEGRYSFGDIATIPYEMAGTVHKASEDATD